MSDLPRIEDIGDGDKKTIYAKLNWAYNVAQECVRFCCQKYGVAYEPTTRISWFQIAYDDTDETSIACYSYEDEIVRVSIRDLRSLFTRDSSLFTEEMLLWYVTAHETTHHWQKLRGDLQPFGNLATRKNAREHYADPCELEAFNCALEVVNERFGTDFVIDLFH